MDGKVIERNWGEFDHSRPHGLLGAYLLIREKELGIYALLSQRIQIRPDRFRVPDVCAIAGARPSEQILTRPPFLCVEILSKEDRMTDMLVKIDDYLSFGVRYVWILDPRTRRAQIYDAAGVHDMKEGKLWTSDPEILVPLVELFD